MDWSCACWPFIQLHFILFQFILFLLHNFYGMQLFSAHGAILLSIELAPSLEDYEDEDELTLVN